MPWEGSELLDLTVHKIATHLDLLNFSLQKQHDKQNECFIVETVILQLDIKRHAG